MEEEEFVRADDEYELRMVSIFSVAIFKLLKKMSILKWCCTITRVVRKRRTRQVSINQQGCLRMVKIKTDFERGNWIACKKYKQKDRKTPKKT